MNLFKKNIWNLNRRSLGGGNNPETDWTIIMLSTLILSIILISIATYIFIQIDQGEIFVTGDPEGKGVEALNTTKLKETVNYYQAKAREFERIRAEGVESVDPSI